MSKRTGFTIVEISIVLVVIGLMIGGIVAGQALVRASKINKTISTMGQYEMAVGNFKRTYGYLPGDVPTGPTLFPECPLFYGNGNGNIGHGYTPVMDDGWYAASERYSAMPQLSYAKMTTEKLTCTGMASGFATDINHDQWRGKNIPSIADNGVLYLTSYVGMNRMDTEYYGITPWPTCRVSIAAASKAPGLNSVVNAFTGPVFTVAESKAMDLKADDGDAVTGKWLFNNGYDGNWQACIDDGDLATTDRPARKFNEALKTKACMIYYCLDPAKLR